MNICAGVAVIAAVAYFIWLAWEANRAPLMDDE